MLKYSNYIVQWKRQGIEQAVRGMFPSAFSKTDMQTEGRLATVWASSGGRINFKFLYKGTFQHDRNVLSLDYDNGYYML